MTTTRALFRLLWTPRVWPFTVAGVSLLLASVFVFFRLGRAQQIAGMVAFVCLGLGVAFGVVEELRPPRARRIRRLLTVLAIGVLAVESVFLSRRGAPPPAPPEQPGEAASEDLVQFAGTLALARRHGAGAEAPPLLRATPDQPVEREIPFTAPKTGVYRLAVQLTDSPFVAAAQRKSDYLAHVGSGRTVGQTFTVGEQAITLAGIRVKLEARSLPNDMPATSAPDAPLVATFSRVTAGGPPAPAVQVELPAEEGGLNDAWRWVTIPFEGKLSSGRTFVVEFTSASEVIGWALAHATKGYEGTDDFYPDGELFLNREVYDLGGDLALEVLGRNGQTAFPDVLVGETPLTLAQTEDDPAWYVSQPIPLQEGAEQTVRVRSENPHISFYRFVFVQEQAPIASPAGP